MRFQNVSIHPSQKVIRNSQGEGGLKAKLLEEKREAKVEFPGG